MWSARDAGPHRLSFPDTWWPRERQLANQHLTLEKVWTCAGPQFPVLTAETENQTPHQTVFLSASLSHYTFSQRHLKIAELPDISFVGSFQHTGNGWHESKQEREGERITRSGGTPGAMAVPPAHERKPLLLDQNQGSARSLEGSWHAQHHCGLLAHIAWGHSDHSAAAEA